MIMHKTYAKMRNELIENLKDLEVVELWRAPHNS